MEIKKFALLIIIFIGFLLRVANIQINPPALYGDELTITLDAYSLLETGHDQLGNFLPLTFPMGAGRPAGYVYGSVPFVAIFGPTTMGVRALSLLSGIGILVLLYFIGKKIASERVGLLAAAIGAVSPWDISLSIGGFEAHFALFLVLLGIYLFILARQRPTLYIFSALSLGLSLHTYPTYKVSLMLFLPLLFWYEKKGSETLTSKLSLLLRSKYFLSGVLVFTFLGILALSQTFLGGSEARFADINILSQGKLRNIVEQKINLERQINNLPVNLIKYFHNKPVEYSKVFLENYLQNFSLDFLILHGDRNPRHNMATMGVLYAGEIILICLGILTFWQKERRLIYFLLLWILIAPIPAAIIDLPHALRSSFMLPPLILLSALGLTVVLNYHSKKLLVLLFTFFIIQFTFFIQKLYFLAPNEYSIFWSYPAKLASGIAIKEKTNFKYIIISDKIDNIEYAYPVYAKINPSVVISQNKNKTSLGNIKFKKFDNIYIGSITPSEIEKFLGELNGSVLYVGSLGEVTSLQGPQRIIGLDGTEVLVLKQKSI